MTFCRVHFPSFWITAPRRKWFEYKCAEFHSGVYVLLPPSDTSTRTRRCTPATCGASAPLSRTSFCPSHNGGELTAVHFNSLHFSPPPLPLPLPLPLPPSISPSVMWKNYLLNVTNVCCVQLKEYKFPVIREGESFGNSLR